MSDSEWPEGAAPVERASTALRRPLDSVEVREILERAGRAEEAAALPDPDNAELGHLMEAASEVGLDPLAVRRAAAVTPVAARSAAATVTGAPDRRTVRAAVGGAVPLDVHPLVAATERVLGRRGEVVQSGEDRFEWRESHGIGRTRLLLERSDSGAELTVSSDRTGHYLVHWAGGLLGWAGLSALAPFSLGPLAAALAFVILPVALARPFWVHSDRVHRRRLEDLAMEVLRVIETGVEDVEG
jgi:hypothetical protein